MFRVSEMLVSKICRESEKEPDKLLKRRERKRLLEEKKDAVEEVAASLLQASIPIVRAQQIQLAVEEKGGL